MLHSKQLVDRANAMTIIYADSAENEASEPHDASKCLICKNTQAFDLPSHLLSELQKQNVVLFAGAGVSTENKTVFPHTLYQEVREELKLPKDQFLEFPLLMEMLCARPNGRKDLLQKIYKRFSYVAAFQELYRTATRFHRELATLFYVQDIVTTNWDDYFERECGAIPLVTPEDFAFWDLPGRKVFKIHGSVNNFGSIVVTEKDYDAAHARLERGTLGSVLKLLLATKTILYIGYSFTDHDFTAIQEYIRKELGELAPQAYIVSLDKASDERFKALNLQPIYTDATHFLSFTKKHLEGNGHYLSDNRFDGIPDANARTRKAHKQLFQAFKPTSNPEVIYCAFYQDGLMHAFERIVDMKKTGEYSHRCRIAEQIQNYNEIRTEKVRARRYTDAAYIDGYMNGLIYLLLNDRERRSIPFFYVYGLRDQPTTFPQFKRALRKNSSLHKGAFALAKRIVAERLGLHDEIHHSPFL